MNNDKIKVFISSSMNYESTLRWPDIRAKLKKILESNSLLRVFEIEDKSATENPEEFFLKNVANSDLIIILIGSVIRTGTYSEYKRALDLGKPILAYFDKTLSNLEHVDVSDPKIKMDATSFKNQLRIENKGTYSETDLLNFDGHNILENTLDEIHSKYVVDTENEFRYSKTLEPGVDDIAISETLRLFKNNKDSLYNILFQKEENVEEGQFGLKSINWLLKGSDLPSTEEYVAFVRSEKNLNGLLPLISKRWKSFQNNMDGNYELAAVIENDVLQELDRDEIGAPVPDWLIDDVLIDCRNLYFSANQYEKGSDIQKRIKNKSNILVYPVLDRFKSEALQELNNEMQKYSLQSANTINIGTSLPVIIGKLQDYFFVALTFGSATHIKGTRRLLADVLYKYGSEFNDSYLAMWAIKLYFLNGQVDIGIKLLRKNEQLLSSSFNNEIDNMFDIFASKYCINSILGEIEFISEWGQQVSKKNFDKEVRFIYAGLEGNADISTSGFGKAVSVIAKRLSADQVIELTDLIIDRRNPIDLGYIPQILISHDVDEYVTQNFINKVSKLIGMTSNKLTFGDMSLLAPDIQKLKNQEKLLDSVKKHSSLMMFKLRLLLDNGKFSKEYLVELKEMLEKEIDNSRQEGISLGNVGVVGCLEPAIIGFKLLQSDIDQSADILMELLKKAMGGKNISIILSILNVIVKLVEKVYLEELKMPKYFKEVDTIVLPESIRKATSMPTFANAYSQMSSLLTIVKKTLASDDSVWLDAYAEVNKYTVKACLLAIARDMRISEYNHNYLHIWMKSKDKEIAIEAIPIAIHLLFCEEEVSILEPVLKLHLSEHVEVRAKALATFIQYKENNKERNFRQIVESFKKDKDWRIRNMASELLSE